MAKIKKVTKKVSAMPLGIGLGILVSLALALLGGVGLAFLLESEKTGMDALSYWKTVLHFAASFLGAAAAVITVKHRKMQVCLLTGAGYFLCLLAINAVFFSGEYESVWATALTVISGSGLAAWIASRGAGGQKRKFKKPVYR